jgi:hypothetical protein
MPCAILTVMAFGQQSGPPASAKDVQRLVHLLQEAGHSDLRDARGPMGFTQRQAAGKFTRDEVAAFIEQLEHEADGSSAPGPVVEMRTAKRSTPTAPADENRSLRVVPTEHLAAELQRRGWVVLEP